MIDIHAHILPSLDDGAKDISDAVKMCAMAAGDGITHIVATPHQLCDLGNPRPEDTRRASETLGLVLEQKGIKLRISASGEVRVVEDIPERASRGELPFLDPAGRYLLLEPPRLGDFTDLLREVVFRLQLQEVTPVIAHPEYVETFQRNPDTLERLIEQGAIFQVTASHLAMALHNRMPDITLDMLARGHIHVVASDAHDPVNRPPILSKARAACADAVGPAIAKCLFESNPARILTGDPVETPGPIPTTTFVAPTYPRVTQWLKKLHRAMRF